MELNKKLLKALDEGSEFTIRIALLFGADANVRDEKGNTALIKAVNFFPRNDKIVKLLLKKGADINAKNNWGWTALMCAVLGGELEIVKQLIKKGADPSYTYKHNDARETINQIAEEKPELFTEKQKLIFCLCSNSREYPPERKGEIIALLRELNREGLLTKKEVLQRFHFIKTGWNENMDIEINGKMKRPAKPDKRKLKRIVN